jgi:hypothetical protein
MGIIQEYIAKEERMSMQKLFYMAPGALRRKYILAWLSTQETMKGLPVNNKYQFNTQYDKDLQILIKKGLVRRIRVGSGYRRGGKNQTYLIVT